MNYLLWSASSNIISSIDVPISELKLRQSGAPFLMSHSECGGTVTGLEPQFPLRSKDGNDQSHLPKMLPHVSQELGCREAGD